MATKVTCIERKYEVEGEKVSYMVTAKKELSEDLTDKLLHEDMELKTFIANYNIEFISEKELKIFKKEEGHIGEERLTRLKILKKEEGHIDEERPTLAKLPTTIQREWVIIHNMPDEFSMQDITNFYKEKDEKYNLDELKKRFSYTIQHLENRNIIEVVNPEANRRYRRYRKLSVGIDKMLKGLKEGEKVMLGIN